MSLLDPVRINIEGHGSFYVTSNVANALAEFAKAGEVASAELTEKTTIWLTGVSRKYIHLIKEVRCVTGLSLKDAKYLCDAVREGQRRSLGQHSYSMADKIRAQIHEAAPGATIEFDDPLTMLARQAE